MKVICECGAELNFARDEDGKKCKIEDQGIDIGFDFGEEIMETETERLVNADDIHFFLHCKKCNTAIELS